MSRIGRLPIVLPGGVKVRLQNRVVTVEGPKGTEQHALPVGIEVEVANNTVQVKRSNDERRMRALHGLTRKLIANCVTGVSQGFTRTLEIVGVGYRAEAKGDAIQFNLGYSHPIIFPLPKGVGVKIDKQTVVTIDGKNRQQLGELAAQIRSLRPPEPYKGKGIKYAEEKLRRKAGKAAGAGSK
jgi:large subunit ribosomal protein L6